MTERHTSGFCVSADHPALPGHFPGTPVVPGVVVLDLVLQAAQEWQARAVSVSGLKQVKFHAPLLPEERAEISLEIDGVALRFQVTRGEQLIAQGAFVMGAPPPGDTGSPTPESSSVTERSGDSGAARG